MNNRYLYRAKRMDKGEWVEGYYAVIGEKVVIIEKRGEEFYDVEGEKKAHGNKIVEVDPSTICQCTGLKDKNGKLIWENDVVKCVDVNAETEFFAVVEFGNPNGFYSWGYQLKHIWGDEPNLDILLWIDMEETGATCEIIGNIFDNPELLEVRE